VLDTNVLISAALSRQGSPYVLVQRALAEARIVFSEPTFEELRGRLYRPKFDRYISLDMRACCATSQPAPPGWKLITKAAGAATRMTTNSSLRPCSLVGLCWSAVIRTC
jgi:hypothetical protein